MKNAFYPCWLIAQNTFLEAVRQKFFYVLLFLSIALLGTSYYFRHFNFGSSELKFIIDFCFGMMVIFGALLAIIITAQLFFSELENRTAITLLAKPVARWQFLIGKFLGVWFLMLAFSLILSLMITFVLWNREQAFMEIPEVIESLAGKPLIHYSDIYLYLFLQWIKLGILSSLTLLIASFSKSNLFTIVVACFAFIICQIQYLAKDYYTEFDFFFIRWIIGLIGWSFPNFQIFNIGDQLVLESPHRLLIHAKEYCSIILYGVAYIIAYSLLSVFSFRKRELS